MGEYQVLHSWILGDAVGSLSLLRGWLGLADGRISPPAMLRVSIGVGMGLFGRHPRRGSAWPAGTQSRVARVVLPPGYAA